jgi:hypothetical protein
VRDLLKGIFVFILAVPLIVGLAGTSCAEHPTSEHPTAVSTGHPADTKADEAVEEIKSEETKKAAEAEPEHSSEHPTEHPA